MHILHMHIIKGISVYRNEKNKGKQAAFKQNHNQNILHILSGGYDSNYRYQRQQQSSVYTM